MLFKKTQFEGLGQNYPIRKKNRFLKLLSFPKWLFYSVILKFIGDVGVGKPSSVVLYLLHKK